MRFDRFVQVISVKEHTSLLVLLPGFCVAMTVTSGLTPVIAPRIRTRVFR